MKSKDLKKILSQKNARIHILGYAGHLSAPLACQLKETGYRVTGSDQEKIYPPATTLFEKAKIPVNKSTINKDIDLLIAGTAVNIFKNLKEEYQKAKDLSLNTITVTQFMAHLFKKENNITIAGAYGKTTITALVTLILKDQGLDPSYMFGTLAPDFKKSLNINNSNWGILEGDESIHGLDTKAKFLHYPAKYVLITSTHWEHKDSYSTSEKNLKAYKDLVQKIPQDGCLIINKKDPNAQVLKKLCPAPVIFYNQKKPSYKTKLLGQYNQENIDAAFTLCQFLGFKETKIKKTIQRFQGLKRRLEFLSQHKNIIFYDDFAQSAPRLRSALKTIKKEYPQKKIKVFFEPRASHLQFKNNLKDLNIAFKDADQIVLGKINFGKNIPKEKRSTFKNYQDQLGKKLTYIPIYSQVFDHYKETLKSGDLLIHFSSGGKDGLDTLKKIITHFK